MWGFLSPIAKAAGGSGTPRSASRGPPVTPASCAKAQQSALAASSGDRDVLVKVTFHAIHESAPENAAMYLTGSLPSLGSWDVKRARKMNRANNGSWALAIYIPEKAEFLYQYLLLQEPEAGAASQTPVVLWEGGLERKCKLVESPNRSMVLADDTRGEGTTKRSPTPPASDSDVQAWIPEADNASPQSAGADSTLSKEEQIDVLLKERERCQNELQKLKDIIGFTSAKASSEYRTRDSYLPETGPLYDTVRELQHFMFKKVADWPTINEGVEGETSPSGSTGEGPSASHAGASPLARGETAAAGVTAPSSPSMTEIEAVRALDEGAKLMSDMKEQSDMQAQSLAESQERLAASETARTKAEAMVQRLKKDLAELQSASDKTAQARLLLDSNLRCSAQELGAVREQYDGLKKLAEGMKRDMLVTMQECSEQVMSQMSATVGGIEEEKGEAQLRCAKRALHHPKETHISLKKRATDIFAELSLKKEMAERRRLHNLVLDLKGNIRVFCRARPPGEDAPNALTFSSETELICDVSGKSHPFSYDCVFGPQSQQGTVFAETQPLVVSVLDGYHACILAYGQTGSGKTHTMQGYDGDPGVNVRAINELFAIAKERSMSHSFAIKVTLIEIYNETLRDLLDPRDEAGKDKALDVKLASSADAGAAGFNGGTCVPGVHVAEVSCMEDVMAALKKGELNRTVAGTDMNERSSRSHMVLSVFVEGSNLSTGIKTYGKLHLIDLAGSERLARSGAQGQQLKEAQNINKSLSALGDCIQSLVAKSKHVPFRNSKLTFFLQDSLGGDSKVLMIVCVSCEEENSNETLCSLNFAARARNVVLGPAKSKATGASDAKLRERERELEASRDAMRKMEAAKAELVSKLADAGAAHDQARAALQQQVEELQGERREQQKRLDALELQVAKQAERNQGKGLEDLPEEEEEEEENMSAEEEGCEAGAGKSAPVLHKSGEAAARWAHPTVSALSSRSEALASPRSRKTGAAAVSKHSLMGNKENGSDGASSMNSPRVRARTEMGAPSAVQNKSCPPAKVRVLHLARRAVNVCAVASRAWACLSRRRKAGCSRDVLLPVLQEKTDKTGAINDRLESRLASLRTTKLTGR